MKTTTILWDHKRGTIMGKADKQDNIHPDQALQAHWNYFVSDWTRGRSDYESWVQFKKGYLEHAGFTSGS